MLKGKHNYENHSVLLSMISMQEEGVKRKDIFDGDLRQLFYCKVFVDAGVLSYTAGFLHTAYHIHTYRGLAMTRKLSLVVVLKRPWWRLFTCLSSLHFDEPSMLKETKLTIAFLTIDQGQTTCCSLQELFPRTRTDPSFLRETTELFEVFLLNKIRKFRVN